MAVGRHNAGQVRGHRANTLLITVLSQIIVELLALAIHAIRVTTIVKRRIEV